MERKKIFLGFSKELSSEPIIFRLAKDYQLEFNILKASINPEKEGSMLIELIGPAEMILKALSFLREKGVVVESFEKKITIDWEQCIHCGLCVGICPTQAYKLEKQSFLVHFEPQQCIMCGLCAKICLVKAINIEERLKEV